jgi:immune inhibitor A
MRYVLFPFLNLRRINTMSQVSWICCAIAVSSLVLCACVRAPTSVPLISTPSPASTPPLGNTPIATATTTSGPGSVPVPPAGLWRDAVPPEAAETLLSLESAEIPHRDLIDLTLRMNDPGQPIPKVARDEAWGFEIGATHKFWVLNWDTREYSQVMARLIYITPHTYFFLEEGVNLNESGLKRLADRFEARIYPTNREFFGEEWSPGVDSDPHVTLLLARDLGYVGGYQNSLDEYSRLVHEYSNEMEILYITADDALLDDDCMLAHEFQHMIQWAVDPNEPTWMNEGFAVLACQVNGLDTSGGEEALVAFARSPDTQLNTWSGEMDQAYAQYGASYLFMAYFLDRFGQDATRALATHQESGLEGVDAALHSLDAGIGFDDVFADWVVANYVNDPNLADGRYGYVGLVPPSFEAEVDYDAGDLPVERRTRVGQYAVDYILLRGEGDFQVDFSGATLVRLAPISAHSGKYAWCGGRGTNGDATLTREFDLTGLQGATLTFYTWYDIEEDYDYAYVEVSADGKGWTTLPGQTTTDHDPNGANYGHGYTDVSQGWIQEKIDLTPYVGQKVQIRFEYLTDDGPIRAGLFLDDIEIPELDYRYDAESGDDGWAARGFIRTANVLPQEWLLQLVRQAHDQTTVERLQLNPDNTGCWTVSLGPDERAVLAVSGRTRLTTEPAEYWYTITANSLP